MDISYSAHPSKGQLKIITLKYSIHNSPHA
jgi:hypothetical protein